MYARDASRSAPLLLAPVAPPSRPARDGAAEGVPFAAWAGPDAEPAPIHPLHRRPRRPMSPSDSRRPLRPPPRREAPSSRAVGEATPGAGNGADLGGRGTAWQWRGGGEARRSCLRVGKGGGRASVAHVRVPCRCHVLVAVCFVAHGGLPAGADAASEAACGRVPVTKHAPTARRESTATGAHTTAASLEVSAAYMTGVGGVEVPGRLCPARRPSKARHVRPGSRSCTRGSESGPGACMLSPLDVRW